LHVNALLTHTLHTVLLENDVFSCVVLSIAPTCRHNHQKNNNDIIS